jgi:hypothetical protein
MKAKAATFVFLLAISAVVVRAQQSTATPSGDVTIGLSAGTAEYCLGPNPSPYFSERGPNDITLRLPLKVWYENHRSETIILPMWSRRLTRMIVTGQNGSTILRDSRRGDEDATAVMAMSRPDTPNSSFLILPATKAQTSTALDWLKCLPENAPGLFSRRVRDSSAGAFFGIGLAGENDSDRDDPGPSVADAGGGAEVERELEELRDRLDGSCGIRYADVPDSGRTADARLPDAVQFVAAVDALGKTIWICSHSSNRAQRPVKPDLSIQSTRRLLNNSSLSDGFRFSSSGRTILMRMA